MFEKIKKMFSPSSKEEATVTVTTAPIEVNPSEDKVMSRKEARLARLLTIDAPTTEIKEEIKLLQKIGN